MFRSAAYDRGLEAKDFRSLRISLASPEQILSWSYGEVTKPETINYRRLRPEKDGLFCEAIFGPTRDWQCYCGKYKNVRYKGIVCDKCGVEITRAAVRRERMGHIDLSAPVAHVWYTRRVPSYLGVLLDISRRNLDRVLYFAQYLVIDVNEDARQKALKRLEEQMAQRVAHVEETANESIAAIKGKRDQEIATLQEALTQKLMQEAQRLEEEIDLWRDQVVQEPLVFDPTGEIIVKEGQEVTLDDLNVLKQAVQDGLEEVEAAIRGDQVHGRAVEFQRIYDWHAGANLEIERIRTKLDQDTEILDTNLNSERDELLGLAPLQFYVEPRLRELKSRWGQVFKAGMGAEAFYEVLCGLDLTKLSKELWNEIRTTRSKQRKKRATRRLRVVEQLRNSDNQPEWMILTVLPVIPPDLRPMVQLDGGRFATSDLNDLYRRVINRNNRLKRLIDLGAPDVIVRNEKRMLQEAVDSLIDNSQRGKALSRRGRRELKSLSDMLKGKKGRFRRNLLGKRVDYSGRSVIVIGPKLKLHQCGLPKTMALELYRPFVIAKLVEYNFASNVKGAKRIIERERPEVWEVLEEVIQDRPVLLNRAPTLHRLGIQAFEPVLVEGKAIQIHPLVCAAFNADFDGDQMAVHVPLSQKAVQEARELMLASKNLLKPSDGAPVVGPSKDMVLGVYYLTMHKPEKDDKPLKAYADMEEVALAYNLGRIRIHDRILLRTKNHYDTDNERYPDDEARVEILETTVGCALFNPVVPEELRFVNQILDKGTLQKLVARCYRRLGPTATTDFVDAIKNIGFKYATISGTTIAVSDLTIPKAKDVILEDTSAQVLEVDRQYRRGLLTEDEQYTKTIELWTRARDLVADAVAQCLDPTGSISVMAKSGATKGGFLPISQMAGMKGMVADPSGRIIDHPVQANFREGLTALEYFISTHGARKGLADTALRTADAGYLTRRLVDVAQDMIVNRHDCGTRGGIWIKRKDNVGGQTLGERVTRRIAAGPIANPETGQVLIDVGEIINEDAAEKVDIWKLEEVYVRSPMTCEMRQGICTMCYGHDLARGKMVQIGSAVGIVAAQSIGEPGTQLTLRTFHTGGVVAGADITHGLPRVEELFEARKKPKGEATISEISGVVYVERTGGLRQVRVVDSEVFEDVIDIPDGADIRVDDGEQVKSGQIIAIHQEEKFICERPGRISIDERGVVLVWERKEEQEYDIPSAARLLVKEAQRIEAGHQLTEGSKNPHHILEILGRDATQLYLLQEVQRVYRSQGVNIHDKHFEIIIRKMLSKVMITSSGDSTYLLGELIDRLALAELNEQLRAEGKQPAAAKPALLGITRAALSTESFLSAASFQHTIKVLSGAAIEGKQDDLFGLKENVIIGKLIPAGTGFRGDFEHTDGPITSFEGVPLCPPGQSEEEREQDDLAKAVAMLASESVEEETTIETQE